MLINKLFSTLPQALMRDQETEAAIEEAEIKNMELNLQKKMFEQVCNCSHHHFLKFLLGFGCVKYCFYNSLASLIRMRFKTGCRSTTAPCLLVSCLTNGW